MKKQFQREAHNRNDKALKPDYREGLAPHPSRPENWTGLRSVSSPRSEREELLKEVSRWFFVYDKWLFRNTTKLSHFALLNSAHVDADDQGLEIAFKICRKNWASDCPKIIRAIKNAKYVILKTSPRWLGRQHAFLDWKLPSEVIADKISKKMPSAFKTKRTSQ